MAKLEATIAELRSLVRAYEGVFYGNPNPAVIFAQDDFRILEANKNAVELYGYTRKEMCEMSLLDLFASDAGERWRASLEAELRKPYNTLGPFVHRGAAGRELVVSMVFSSFAIKGRDARIMQIQDETTRRTAEEAVRASEERFRELFENANDVIFLHDLKGRLMAINRAAESFTGYARAEVLGKSIEELIAPESRHFNQDSIRAHLGGSPNSAFRTADAPQRPAAFVFWKSAPESSTVKGWPWPSRASAATSPNESRLNKSFAIPPAKCKSRMRS